MTSFKTAIRRLATFVLAVLLTASMAFGVSAKSFDDVGEDYSYAEQVDILSDIGIIVGTSADEFSPDVNVTREQMALLLFRTMLARSSAGTENTTSFTDLYDPTYNGAISWANAAGYIIGTSATTFNPKGGITLQDAMTMVIRALGFSTPSMDRGYPWTYINEAVKLGLDNGLEGMSYTKTLTRGETAAIIYNALITEYPVQVGNRINYTTLIESVFGYEYEDCTIVATNKYTIEDNEPVIKNGYVAIQSENRILTVKFAELGLEGTAESWLGKTVKVIYKIDSKTNLVTVTGASYTGVSETFEAADVTVSANGSYIVIDGVSYKVVAAKSHALNTNENELYVYAYDADGKLSKYNENSDVTANRFYEIELITDNEGAEAADRAILKPWSYGRYTALANGTIIAGGNTYTAAALTGGVANTAEAANGDFIFFYYNAANRSLEISEKLTATASALVTRLTSDKATIGGVEYKLAYAPAGALTIGQTASVIAKDGYILEVVGATPVVAESNYLVAVTGSTPVYVNGYIRHAFTANIGGVSQAIIAAQPATAAAVYRYTVDANGVYTLIAADQAGFSQTQYGETHKTFTNLTAMELTTTLSTYYSVDTAEGKLNFITDEDTVIIVKTAEGYIAKTGVYTGKITIDAGASAVAVFTESDDMGNVKILDFLFINTGALELIDVTNTYVQILAPNGSEWINGKVYSIYIALDVTTGKIDSYKSTFPGLVNGKVYVLDTSGNITDSERDLLVSDKTFNGYTASTVTIDSQIFRYDSDLSVIRIDNLTATEITLAEVSGKVTYYEVNDEVILIIDIAD